MIPNGRFAHLAANAVWRDIDWAHERLRPFAGRTVHIAAWPLPGIAMRVAANGSWEDATLTSAADADVRLRLFPALIPRVIGAADKAGSSLDGDGDPEFLQALRDLGEVLPLAFEERLSSVIGRLAAHGVASTMRSLASWPAIAGERIGAGIGAYFTEETQALLKKSTLASFAAELAELAARVDVVVAHVAHDSSAQQE